VEAMLIQFSLQMCWSERWFCRIWNSWEICQILCFFSNH